MTLEEIQNSWKDDATITEDLGDASKKIPNLHAKYLTMLSNENVHNRTLTNKLSQMEVTLSQYFEGQIDGKAIGRPPFQLLVKTKEKVAKLIEADFEYQKLADQVALSKEKMLFLKEVITNINQRNYQIKNSIEWAKFTSGA